MATQTWTVSETTCDNCGDVMLGPKIHPDDKSRVWSLVEERSKHDFCSEKCADDFYVAEEEQKRLQEATAKIGEPKYTVGQTVKFEYVTPCMGMVSANEANNHIKSQGIIRSVKPYWCGSWFWQYRVKENPEDTHVKLIFENEIKEAK